VACPKVTNRWPLNSNWASGSTVIDSVGLWNGTAFGGFSYSADNTGAIALDGVSGYVGLGTHTFGGASACGGWRGGQGGIAGSCGAAASIPFHPHTRALFPCSQ
jgi:hypothetical protein